jgi:alpha-tubulin suppressor-like RCC1 family protein
LGNGATTSRCQPGAICCNYAYCCIVSGDYVFVTVLGLKTDGCAVGWGYSGWGSIGTNTSDVCQPAPVCCNYTYCDISLNTSNSVAIKTDGKAVTWGSGGDGELGNGGTAASSQPVAVCCNYDYCSVAAGYFNVMAVKRDGCAVSWGYNDICQLGDRTTTSRCQPVAVCGFPV